MSTAKHTPTPFTAEELRILRARHAVRVMESGDTVIALLDHIERLAAKLSREENEHAELQSRCFEGFPSVSDGIFDANKDARNSHDALVADAEHTRGVLRSMERDYKLRIDALVAKNAELSRLLDEQTTLALMNHTNMTTQRDALVAALIEARANLRHARYCLSNQPMVPPKGFNRYPCDCGIDHAREVATAALKAAKP